MFKFYYTRCTIFQYNSKIINIYTFILFFHTFRKLIVLNFLMNQANFSLTKLIVLKFLKIEFFSNDYNHGLIILYDQYLYFSKHLFIIFHLAFFLNYTLIKSLLKKSLILNH